MLKTWKTWLWTWVWDHGAVAVVYGSKSWPSFSVLNVGDPTGNVDMVLV